LVKRKQCTFERFKITPVDFVNARRFFRFSADSGDAGCTPVARECMPWYATALLACVVFGSCSAGGTSDAGREAVRREVLGVLHLQERCWNDGDIDGYMSGYAKTDSVRFVSGATVSRGWNTMRDRYRAGYPTKARMGMLRFDELDVQVLCADAALAFGRWTLTRAGDTPTGYFTLLFRRTADGWRIVHDHTSK
jgi:ketosteroid isomerase-like protein